MASVSENTFGTRVLNAQTLATHLATFTGYAPPRPTEALASLNTLIAAFKTSNSNEATKLQSYSLAVESRQKAFSKDADSLSKLLSPIGSAVRSQYGKSSKEASTVSEMIVNMRGRRIPKDPQNLSEAAISTSALSYGSITHNFSDLYAALSALAPAYNPANNFIKLPALATKATLYNTVNTAVISCYGNLVKERKTRNDLYADLKERCSRIKESVKSQYGLNSSEYKLIKGLKI
jgi:hypothetical protein